MQQGGGGAKGLWRSEPWCPVLVSIIITTSNEKRWPQHPETRSAHIFALDYESRAAMRGVQGLHPAAKTNTSAVFPLFISCDTEIRGHHDTIEPPHFRLISRFRPKTHLHSLRAVKQTDSLQKTHFLTNSWIPTAIQQKPWDPDLTLRVMEFHLWTISINMRWQVINFLSAFSSPTSIFNH